jgi:hypothetical protein
MRSFFLVLCLLSATPSAFAAYCSKAPVGQPCTPDPGEKTELAKEQIRGLITDAQDKGEPQAGCEERRDHTAKSRERISEFPTYDGIRFCPQGQH